MKKILLFALAATLVLQSCKKKEGCTDPTATNYDADAVKDDGSCTYGEGESKDFKILEGDLTSSLILTKNNKYLIKGFAYVRDGGILKIEAGTIIKGDKDTKGTLIIERGGKLLAEGKADAPIVFTSNQPAGSRSYGDWGGIILCGKAPINLPGGEGVIEGGVEAKYGGSDAADNSGILKYVRIEFCGIPFQPNQEINGLTLGGVGSGTVIENIQVSYSGDDSYEWFGGTVNCKRLIAFRGWDDDFDCDNGFSGNVQYAFSLRDPNVADQSGSNGFEIDNDAAGTDATPYTSPTFSNVTIYGPKTTKASTAYNTQFQRAAHLRRASRAKIYNSVLVGFPVGLLLDGSKVEANATNGNLVFANSVIAGNASSLKVSSTSSFDINAWFTTSTSTKSDEAAQVGLSGWENLTNPTLLPSSGSALLTGAATVSGMESVTFRGAFGTENWTSGWANFDPQNTPY